MEPELASLPAGWTERLVVVRNENTRGATAFCLEANDLVIAKLMAGREKDLEFARVALAAELVAMPVLRARLADVEADPRLRERAAGLLDLLAAGG